MFGNEMTLANMCVFIGTFPTVTILHNYGHYSWDGRESSKSRNESVSHSNCFSHALRRKCIYPIILSLDADCSYRFQLNGRI